jgi:hypothetical protein
VEWCKEEDGPEDNSPMDTNQSWDIYHKHTVGPERLEDWRDTIWSDDVQAYWLSSQEDMGKTGW